MSKVLKENEVTHQGLVDALSPAAAKPAASAPSPKPEVAADPTEFGHFSQDKPNYKYDASKLVGQTITRANYQPSGLAKSAETYVSDMMNDKTKGGGAEIAADLMKRIGDIDGDGKVDKKDLAAAIVAASLDGKGKFDNGVSAKEFEKLFGDKATPETIAAVAAAAKQFAGAGVSNQAAGAAVPSKAAGTSVAQR